ncbi:MAG: neutral/alkaline non-lysosomal ceramidase N-terminal domain-containing protein [Armatimonadetes bacterium]|nr:neutral/alkaline non-lysosomal ceramidase N-terminal domain-containing protein [Armatimonadota bacterium]
MIKVGTGTKVITPPVGTSLAGYFHERKSTAVHDDLLAKAVVLDSGTAKAAICVCDLLWIQSYQTAEVRRLVHSEVGIPPENIMVSATHTHTGPETRIHQPLVLPNDKYVQELPRLIADAIIEAHSNMKPATLRLGEEYEDRIAFNRRYRMKDGSVRFNPGKLNPDILGPDGPIDPQVNVLRIDGEDGMPTAILANYALHVDVVGGCEISADFPGEMARIVSDIYESKPLVVFVQGAQGNINHLDVSDPRKQSGWGEAVRIARVLAGKVLAASELSTPMSSEVLAAKTRILDILYHPLTDQLRRRAAEVRSMPSPSEFDLAQAKLIEKYELDGKNANVELQVIRVGDTAFAGIPGEYFVEYGLSIKEWSPFSQTFIVGLANACFGYIPTQDAFYPGTYETMPILSATLEPSAGVRIANAAGDILREVELLNQ